MFDHDVRIPLNLGKVNLGMGVEVGAGVGIGTTSASVGFLMAS